MSTLLWEGAVGVIAGPVLEGLSICLGSGGAMAGANRSPAGPLQPRPFDVPVLRGKVLLVTFFGLV